MYLAGYGTLRLRAFDGELRRLQRVLEQLNAGRPMQPVAVDLSLANQAAALGLGNVDFAATDSVRIGLVAAGAGAASYLAPFGAARSLSAAATPAAARYGM